MSRSATGRWIVGAVLATALGLTGAARAGDITVNCGATQAALANADASLAAPGDLIVIGTFDPGFAITANQADLAALQAHFTVFATGVVGTNLDLNGVWSMSSTADEGRLAGTPIYLWTFNAATAAAATQQGIFSSPDPAWRFPRATDVPPVTTIDLAGVEEIFAGANGPTVEVRRVSLPSFTMAASFTNGPATGSLIITKLQAGLNFARTSADMVTIKGALDLPADYRFAGKQVTVDAGAARVSFTLDSKGCGVGAASKFSRPSFNKRTGLWGFTASLKRGAWQAAWAPFGMTNATVPKPGVAITNFPVLVVVGPEAFLATTNLRYTATAGRAGTAK